MAMMYRMMRGDFVTYINADRVAEVYVTVNSDVKPTIHVEYKSTLSGYNIIEVDSIEALKCDEMCKEISEENVMLMKAKNGV